MKCLQCGDEFEPKRKTARFHSDKCRLDYNRNKGPQTITSQEEYDARNDAIGFDGIDEGLHPAPEISKKEKKTCMRTEKCCAQCKDFESGIHWCPNKECGCFQTKEEQEADIEEMQKKCLHPKDLRIYSRCGDCGAVMSFRRTGMRYLSKEFCKKHDFTLKSSCGCK